MLSQRKINKPEDLTPRQGKILRYVTSRFPEYAITRMCISHQEWSDLPQNFLQAIATLEQLRAFGLVESTGSGIYRATDEGLALIKVANKMKAWRS